MVSLGSRIGESVPVAPTCIEPEGFDLGVKDRRTELTLAELTVRAQWEIPNCEVTNFEAQNFHIRRWEPPYAEGYLGRWEKTGEGYMRVVLDVVDLTGLLATGAIVLKIDDNNREGLSEATITHIGQRASGLSVMLCDIN